MNRSEKYAFVFVGAKLFSYVFNGTKMNTSPQVTVLAGQEYTLLYKKRMESLTDLLHYKEEQ